MAVGVGLYSWGLFVFWWVFVVRFADLCLAFVCRLLWLYGSGEYFVCEV